MDAKPVDGASAPTNQDRVFPAIAVFTFAGHSAMVVPRDIVRLSDCMEKVGPHAIFVVNAGTSPLDRKRGFAIRHEILRLGAAPRSIRMRFRRRVVPNHVIVFGVAET